MLAQIAKGEERIAKKIRMKQALAQKVAQYKVPDIQLRVPYGTFPELLRERSKS